MALYEQGYALFGPRQADQYLEDLERAFQRIAEFPGLGRLRTDYTPPARILPFRSHVIVYDEEDTGIVIVRVRHAREDWRSDPRGSESERE
ncbi:MAG: type II toxin-antitoxin system RelE/ParE family toxin [Caulobacteraceae bacterium]|nr:type II toxin-antitoxin system RelE/ParE family toxin [Caulobacteraceae bacterium]